MMNEIDCRIRDCLPEGLRAAHTLPGLMCRHQLSIDWDGTVYDCDFNLAIGLPVNHDAPNKLSAFDSGKLAERIIMTGDHCFGCTAGSGSSCAGALAEQPDRPDGTPPSEHPYLN